MSKDFKTLAPLLRTLVSEVQKGKGSLLFCQSSNQEELAAGFLHHLDQLGSSGTARYFHFSFPGYNPKPYAPFMELCKDLLADSSRDKLLKLADDPGVYHYHRPLLAEYLQSGTALRREDILPGELDYETYRMHQSVWSLVRQLTSEVPVILLIENAHYLPRSSLRLLKMVLKNSIPVPFLGIFLAPQIVQSITDSEDSPWNRVLELADQRGLVLNFRQQEGSELFAGRVQPYRQVLEDPQFYDGINAYNLLALDDSEKIFQSFVDLQLYNRALPHIRFQVWKYLGMISKHREHFETARQHFEQALGIAQQASDDRLVSEAYQRLGMAYLGMGNYDYALKMARQAQRFAEKSGDRYRLFGALFLMANIDDMLNPDDIHSFRESFEPAVELARELGLENTYTFLLSSIYGISTSVNSGAFRERSFPSLVISRKRGNVYREAVTYHALGMVYITHGDYKKVLRYYRKSRKLKLTLPDQYEPATTYNGMGFYYLYTGDYRQSLSNFEAAMELLRGVTQYREVAMTFYNLGMWGFLSRNYGISVNFTNSCLTIMKVLGLEDLSFHSKAAVMLLMGLSLIKSGNMVRAWQLRTQVELEHRRVYERKAEELFLSHFFEALYYRDSGDLSQAGKAFTRARTALESDRNNTLFLYPVFFLELGDHNLLKNDKAEAREAFSQGLEVARQSGNRLYEGILAARLESGQIAANDPKTSCRNRICAESRDIQWAVNGARMHSSLASLRKRLEDINQLNMLFSVVTEEQNVISLVQKTMDMIYSHFEMDFEVLIYLSQKRREFQQIYIREKTPIKKNEQFTSLVRQLAGMPESVRFTPVSDLREFSGIMKPYGGVISIKVNPRGENAGLILCFTRGGENRIRSESLQLFVLIAQQFGLALDKLNQQQTIMLQNEELKAKNELLKQSSTTDYLTNLGNRASLYDVLEYEVSRINRYNRDGRKPLSLLFIDLDNFKFFNDTYGHSAGDLLLVQVSRTIRSVIRHIDTAFRYGGDEFVVILPETDEDGAGELGVRIIKEIEEQDSYKSHLEDLLGRSLSIPEDKRLSCSIGIAASTRLGKDEPDVDMLLNIADKALYQAKLLGKHRVYLA